MPEIKFENVFLRYGNKDALQNVSFTLKENTICGLLGRNGAGKTSLMALLASYRPPTSGSITVEGKPGFDNPEVMSQVAFVRSRSEEYNSTKVKEYMRMAEVFRPRWDAEYARRLLELFEIPENKTINVLSRGMQAAVQAILGLASRTPITLYDEAYLGMDAAVRRKFIHEILEDYMRNPRTILFSTHYIAEVENMLEEILILSEGSVLLHEDCDRLRDRGAAISGNIASVDELVARFGWEPLSDRTLGNQKEIILFGTITEEQCRQVEQLGLSLARPPLQDLFIHITEKEAFSQENAIRIE